MRQLPRAAPVPGASALSPCRDEMSPTLRRSGGTKSHKKTRQEAVTVRRMRWRPKVPGRGAKRPAIESYGYATEPFAERFPLPQYQRMREDIAARAGVAEGKPRVAASLGG